MNVEYKLYNTERSDSFSSGVVCLSVCNLHVSVSVSVSVSVCVCVCVCVCV